jgi:hypothetical protein
MASNNQNFRLSDYSSPSSDDNKTDITDNYDDIIEPEALYGRATNRNHAMPGAISGVIAKMGVFDGDYDGQNE